MDAKLTPLTINVPETCLGEVSGELNRRGAWLDSIIRKDGACVLETRIPVLEVKSFEAWLKEKLKDGSCS
jgi:hypothetical protein